MEVPADERLCIASAVDRDGVMSWRGLQDADLIDRPDGTAVDSQHRTADIVGVAAGEIGDGRGDLFRPSQPSDVIRNHIPHAAALDVLPAGSPSEARRYPDQQLLD